MKDKFYYLIVLMLISSGAFAQFSTKECTYCKSNELGNSSSAIGVENISTGEVSFASGQANQSTATASTAFGYQSVASANYSFAGGEKSIASQKWAFAFGQRALADGFRTFAQGMDVTAMGTNSVVMGRYAQTLTGNTMIFGYGVDPGNYLKNSIPYSLMVGFNSDIPTLFVGASSGVGTTGNVGIGTSLPSEKLEVNGRLKVSDWSYMNTIDLSNTDIKNIDELQGNGGLKFKGETLLTSTQMILTEDGNLGIGNLTPTYPLDVAGNIHFTGQLYDANGLFKPSPWETNDNNLFFNTGRVAIGTNSLSATLSVGGTLSVDNNIYISGENAGMVLTSPDGQCWKASINNNGTWIIEPGDCLTTSANETLDDLKQVGPVLIFPNPASDEIRIQKRQSGKYFATITNAGGNLYSTIELRKKETLISLRNLPSGLVIVTIIDRLNRIVQTEKIVIR